MFKKIKEFFKKFIFFVTKASPDLFYLVKTKAGGIKMKKNLFRTLLVIVLVISSVSGAGAFEDATPFTGDVGNFYTYEVINLSGPTLRSQIFVQYLTSFWAHAQSYTYSESTTTHISFSGSLSTLEKNAVAAQFGLSWSKTTTRGAAVTIPADPSRLSKLALHADFIYRFVRVNTYNWGALESSKLSEVNSPTNDHYLLVRYQ